MNACDEDTRDLLLYLDNELRGQELKHFLAHLAGCAVCRNQLDEQRELLDLLHRSRPLYTAPDQLRARLTAARRVLESPRGASPLLRGVLYGTAIWLLNALIVLPAIGEGIAGQYHLSAAGIGGFPVAHMSYFLTLSLLKANALKTGGQRRL